VDVWDYFIRREAECDEMSVDCRNVQFFAELGSDDRIGTMVGRVFFNNEVYLAIHERIEIVDGAAHRTDYAYFLIMDETEYWGYERDPSHDPPVHRHTFGHGERVESDPVTFKKVCELAWSEVSRRETSE
jgi:hypothetical protein